MAGSPKKRAKREAAERARLAEASANTAPTGSVGEGPPAPPASVPVVQGEVVPNAPLEVEPTRTALKRAMRARAQEYAKDAIEVLAKNLKSADPRIATAAANDLLAWGFGKPAQEIEAGEGAQLITILKFGDQQ